MQSFNYFSAQNKPGFNVNAALSHFISSALYQVNKMHLYYGPEGGCVPIHLLHLSPFLRCTWSLRCGV